MKGWQIFAQSVLRVVNNIGAAIRISAVPYIIVAAVAAALLLPTIGLIADREAMTAAIQNGTFPWINFLVVVVVAVVGTLWVAVAWHRYILLDETPGIVPPFNGGRMAAYFLRGLVIVLIMIPVLIAITIVASLLLPMLGGASASPIVLTIISLVFSLPIFIIGIRMSTSLPGVAVGAGTGIGDGWRATAGQLGAFVVLAIILAVVGAASEYVSGLLSQNSALLMAWSIIYGWISAMVGVSILTTLYGHFVENRSL